MKPLITMIVPYYRQPNMLRKQLETWDSYAPEVRAAFRFIVVDDCSPEPAERVLRAPPVTFQGAEIVWDPPTGVSLYRIDKDIPWNRGMARNLGTHVAETEWILHVDTDHVLPPESAAKLVQHMPLRVKNQWYRFARFRIGAADETRKKDKVPDSATNVEIHPHIDSYLCTPEAYWTAGGYNEDFSGVLGGGSPFLKEMEKAHGPPPTLNFVRLHVHTRHSVPDSSEHTLPRDPAAFAQRKREIMRKHGSLKGRGLREALRLPWHRVF